MTMGTWEDLIFTIHERSKTIVERPTTALPRREFEAFGFIPRSFMLESRGGGTDLRGPSGRGKWDASAAK